MNELSLFTGAGGGLLGTKLLGWTAIGYVEINEYCQRLIKQRIEDGILNEAPIFGDIQAFINQGYADAYSGLVDVITAGFPCQPFSQAGKQKGGNDERNMWPSTIECIRRIRPKFALLENVPGLLTHEYSRTIFRELAESGYECRWRILSAAEMGAPHRRDRLWIVAYTDNDRFQGCNTKPSTTPASSWVWDDIKRVVGEIQKGKRDTIPGSWIIGKGSRVSGDVDRIKALGNAQVPAVVKAVWELLNV